MTEVTTLNSLMDSSLALQVHFLLFLNFNSIILFFIFHFTIISFKTGPHQVCFSNIQIVPLPFTTNNKYVELTIERNPLDKPTTGKSHFWTKTKTKTKTNTNTTQTQTQLNPTHIKKDGAPLPQTLAEISKHFDRITELQTYLKTREVRARDLAEYTNGRVFMYSIIEALVLVIISVGNVYFLRRYFEPKR